MLFIFLCTVVAAACQDMWPAFGGAKPPFLLALVLHWAFAQRQVDESDRHVEKPSFYAARWLPAALLAGIFEDALSGFPSGCATGFFLLAGAAARFLRNCIHALRPAVLGFVVVTIAAPAHELWLAVWGVVGDESAVFIRFFAASLPAAPLGALMFCLLPKLENAVGFEGPFNLAGRTA